MFLQRFHAYNDDSLLPAMPYSCQMSKRVGLLTSSFLDAVPFLRCRLCSRLISKLCFGLSLLPTLIPLSLLAQFVSVLRSLLILPRPHIVTSTSFLCPLCHRITPSSYCSVLRSFQSTRTSAFVSSRLVFLSRNHRLLDKHGARNLYITRGCISAASQPH